MKLAAGCWIAGLLALSGAPAMAMYRCGNVFQDTPCTSGTEIRLSPSGRPAPAQPAAPAAPAAAAATAAPAEKSAPPATPSSFAVACARVGDQAQRIVWKREAGATQEQQLAERATVLPPSEQTKTIAAVYARRGNAPEIRAAIEAECVVDRQKEAAAAELLGQLRKQAGETGATAPVASSSAGDSAQTRPAASSKPSVATCARLRQTLAEANGRLSQGGSARSMEQMQNDRRNAEAAFRGNGCA